MLPYGSAGRIKVVEGMIREGKHTATEYLEAIKQVINDLPCTLVYRDLEEIVRMTVKAVDAGGDLMVVRGAAEAIGIGPETYDPERRPKAFREVLAFINRLQDMEVESRSKDRDDVINELKRSFATLREGRWHKFVSKWVNNN
jgi:hypothetical protein